MFDIKVEKLSQGLDFLSIDYDHNLINKFILYYEFLNKENKKYNLTSITDFDDFISLHVLDSLSVLLPIQKYNINHQNILDIGSGSGENAVYLSFIHPHAKIITCELFGDGNINLSNEIIKKSIDKTNNNGSISIHENKSGNEPNASEKINEVNKVTNNP